jgi:mannose-6-phosphate isomerase-like protein (cupin superfamily)
VTSYDVERLSQWIIDVLCGVEDVSKNPYIDEKLSNTVLIRTFDPSLTESNEYVWHRDEKDRIVTILAGDGWQFQIDDDIPKRINKGEIILIPKQVYHRIIIGKTPLKIKIEEVE